MKRLLGRTSGKDKTPPLITISSPLDSIAYSSTVPLDYVVSDKGSLTCWYSLSGVNGNVNLPGCANTNIGPFTDGSHTLTLYANDLASAIMAREFKIPCVIGTKLATRIIKDGDLVEVNANKGIVKIGKQGPGTDE